MRWMWLLMAVGCAGDGGSGSETGDPTGDTGEICDPTGTPLAWYCQSDLCNLCTDCDDESEVLVHVPLCDTDPYVYGCCTLDTCTDPELGVFDRIQCPEAYGARYWWFDPTSQALVGYAWSTDYNDWCDGASAGELYGPDLTDCQ